MSLIAYPPVFDAKRVTPLRKEFMRARSKRRCVKVISPAERAQAMFEDGNQRGLKMLRDRGMPEALREIVKTVAAERGVVVLLIAGNSRRKAAVHARNEAMYLIKELRPHLAMSHFAKWFDRDHTSAMHGIASHAEMNGFPELVGYDVARVRERNARISAMAREKAKTEERAR